MNVDHPERDQNWDNAVRSESPVQRLDRNWDSLLQELRVTQTGVQLLTGFLLTLPFQYRFTEIGRSLQTVYLATVACSLGATVLLVAPVAMHRLLFRRHQLGAVVSVAHRCTYAGLLLLGGALIGVAVVVFGTVLDARATVVAGALTAAALLIALVMVPLALRSSVGRCGSDGCGFDASGTREPRRHADPENRPSDVGGSVHRSGNRRATPPDECR